MGKAQDLLNNNKMNFHKLGLSDLDYIPLYKALEVVAAMRQRFPTQNFTEGIYDTEKSLALYQQWTTDVLQWVTEWLRE